MILVDTNVLLRVVQPSHSQHAASLAALSQLRLANETLCIVPQVLYEYWVVATRPHNVNGLGMTTAEAERDVVKLVERFRLLRDERGVFDRWQQLVTRYEVLGKNAHDARLVAAMQRHSITRLLTFNWSDFARLPGIEVLNAATIATPR